MRDMSAGQSVATRISESLGTGGQNMYVTMQCHEFYSMV